MKTRSLVSVVSAVVVAAAGFAAGYGMFRAFRAAREESAREVRPPVAAPRQAEETPGGADWNTYHGPGTLTGVASVPLPDSLEILWRFKAGAPVRQTPAVCAGRVYFATGRGEVFAVDFEGQRVWSRELFTGETQNGALVREQIEAPVACFNGLVVAGTMRGMVYALDAASGVDLWSVQLDGPVMGTANYLAAKDGARVYVVTRTEGVLHCLDADSGSVLWRAPAGNRCDSSPAVSDGAAVFGSCAAALHVFSPETGELLHRIEIDPDSQVAAGAALDGDWVVAGCRGGKVVQANTKTGAIAWVNTASTGDVFTTPAVTAEWAVVASNDGGVYGLDRATGTQRWRFDTKKTPSSPVIAADKVAVAADGELFLLRLADGAKLWSVEVSDGITSPAVAQDRVFVGSEDGTLAAFGPARQQEGATAS